MVTNDVLLGILVFIVAEVVSAFSGIAGGCILVLYAGYTIYQYKQQKKSDGKMINYIIRKGKHYADGKLFGLINFGIIFKDLIYRIQGKVTIHESMYYNDIAGWNKIVGFNGVGIIKNPYAPGYIPKREIYLVWRCEKKKLKLGIYSRDLGAINEQSFNTIFKPGDLVSYKISETTGQYVITIEKMNGRPAVETLSLEKSDAKIDLGFRLLSFPYFGGREPAPHDIKVQIIK